MSVDTASHSSSCPYQALEHSRRELQASVPYVRNWEGHLDSDISLCICLLVLGGTKFASGLCRGSLPGVLLSRNDRGGGWGENLAEEIDFECEA